MTNSSVNKNKTTMLASNNIGFICTRLQCDQGREKKVALRWVESQTLDITDYTFLQLEEDSNRFANVLTALGFSEGEIVFSILPKMPEIFPVFLGILKTKVIAGMLFSNFGDEALQDRLSEANGIIMKLNSLKKILKIRPFLKKLKFIIVIDSDEHIDQDILSYKQLMEQASSEFSVPPTSENTPSILHYTSGSTGKSKGVLHVHGSVRTQSATARDILQLNDQTNYWCTADQGWVTGTSYGIIGPWSLGVTQIHFGGGYNPTDWFRILERERINVWYTAPTALRMLMREDEAFYQKFNLDDLQYIFSVGEPLNPEVLNWSRMTLKRDIYDTWFQTETGAIMVANRPGLEIKPGSMGKPVEGISLAIINENHKKCASREVGHLSITPGWHSMFRTYLNNEDVYKNKFKNGYYFSGDKAYQDEQGYFWFVGRNDDVINTSGHLVSPFEVESSLLEVEEIFESAVIGAPDDLLFEKVVAFLVLNSRSEWSRSLELKIKLHIMNRLSAIATPSEFIIMDKLPKNKSGKILRRVLKADYLGEDAGDISTMED